MYEAPLRTKSKLSDTSNWHTEKWLWRLISIAFYLFTLIYMA